MSDLSVEFVIFFIWFRERSVPNLSPTSLISKYHEFCIRILLYCSWTQRNFVVFATKENYMTFLKLKCNLLLILQLTNFFYCHTICFNFFYRIFSHGHYFDYAQTLERSLINNKTVTVLSWNPAALQNMPSMRKKELLLLTKIWKSSNISRCIILKRNDFH